MVFYLFYFVTQPSVRDIRAAKSRLPKSVILGWKVVDVVSIKKKERMGDTMCISHSLF